MPTDRTFTRKASAIYADTLIAAAKAQGTVFEVSGQLEFVLSAIRGNIDLRRTLTDRTLDCEIRASLFREVFAGLDLCLIEVLAVMVSRDDVALLSRINEAYLERAEDELSAVILDVTTVVELDDGLRSRIKEKYSAQFGKGVLLREHIDSSLVGGIVLSTHGRRVDASVASQLDVARAVLSKQV